MIDVSVILPVYNEEKYIEQCLKSLINQDYPKRMMEWIIIDGKSTDRTVEIIDRYKRDYPIMLLENNRRKTPISLNIGIRESHGKYIVRFDAHTSFPSNYITSCISEIERTGADNVGGCIDTKAEGLVGEAIASILSSKFGVGGSTFRTGAEGGYVDTVPFGTFRREVFDNIGYFNEQLLRSEDNDINARIREKGGRVYLSDFIKSTYFCRNSVPALLKMALQNGNALFSTIRVNPKAMNIRHFIPFLFLSTILLFPLLGMVIRIFMWIFIAEMIAYGFLDIFFSAKYPNYFVITIWLYPLFHIFYGIGSLIGLVGFEMY